MNTLSHVTLAHNDARYGSSIYIYPGGKSSLHNSIAVGMPRNEECYGLLESNVGSLSQDGSCGSEQGADPILGDLVEPEDGTPPYYPLLPGSPAIDAAIDEYCTEADQIGGTRPQGQACDIGAIEYVPPTRQED